MPPLGVWMGQLNFSLPEWSEWSERLPLPRNNELTKVLLPHKCRRWSLLRLPPAEVCRLWSSGRDEFCWGCFWSPCVCSFKNLLGDAEASGDGEVSPGRSWICVWSSRYLINTLKERGLFFLSDVWLGSASPEVYSCCPRVERFEILYLCKRWTPWNSLTCW